VVWAKKKGGTTSSYFMSFIREAMAQEDANNRRPGKTAKELEAMRIRIGVLESELREKNTLIAQLQAEKERMVLEDKAQDLVELPARLIKVLQENSPVGDKMLLMLLGFGPDDIEMRDALTKQLEILEGNGMLRRGRNGWSWIK